MDPFIGEIIMFAGNFAPRGWAFCDGQLLAISSNQALFSILGTTYGGDGRTTFGLPDLRSRVPLHPGSGPGLPTYRLGQKGGTASETLSAQQMPSHTHTLRGVASAGNSGEPAGKVVGMSGEEIYSDASADTNLSAESITNEGGSQSHNNMPPYQGVNFIIALVGVFPSRN
jgi:microcystin-dependent protein